MVPATLIGAERSGSVSNSRSQATELLVSLAMGRPRTDSQVVMPTKLMIRVCPSGIAGKVATGHS